MVATWAGCKVVGALQTLAATQSSSKAASSKAAKQYASETVKQ
jgi:hypothetical protein